MIVRLQRTSNTHHRMEVVRPGQPVEVAELETRVFLLHDLVHLALEEAAGLRNSFYGLLAQGRSLASLQHDAIDATAPESRELLTTEQVTGPLQGAWRRPFDPEQFVATLRAYLESCGSTCPEWLETATIQRTADRLRQLEGRWRATPFAEAMELGFELPPARG